MQPPGIGDQVPSFRLPAAQGGELGPEDYRGRAHLILFFAKGMACCFCRQMMSQLGRGAARFRALDTEILMISPTTPQRGRFYARNFALPFPYLCDPDYRVFEAYGMPPRRRSLLWKVQYLRHASAMPHPEPTELGDAPPALSELPRLLNDDDLGFFVVDRAGVLRYTATGPYTRFEGARPVGMQTLPSNDEIAAVLQGLAGRPAASPQRA